jgi:hypothetical protein
MANEVYRVIVGKPEHPDHFPYIDCWQGAVLRQPTLLRSYVEEATRIMVAKVARVAREKTKKPILAKESKEMPLPYVHPVPHPSLQHWMGKPVGPQLP